MYIYIYIYIYIHIYTYIHIYIHIYAVRTISYGAKFFPRLMAQAPSEKEKNENPVWIKQMRLIRCVLYGIFAEKGSLWSTKMTFTGAC